MGKITILDGGMGGELKAMGAPFVKPEWSALALMQAPETVIQVHHAFMDAGCDVITTNAYALCPFHIGQDKFDQDGEDLIKLAADIARTAADGSHNRPVKVAGCLPPVFGSYRPDLFDADKAIKLYEPLIKEQVEQVDFWLAETMSSITEAQTVAKLTAPTHKELWLAYSLTDDTTEDAPSTLRSGETVEEAVQAALALNVSALLFNCSQPEVMEKALTIVKGMKINIPYGVYANTFPPKPATYLANDEQNQVTPRDDITIDHYLDYARKWADQGATIIGGCCGIGPDHIEALTSLNK